MRIERQELHIHGLSRRYRFMQITDCHCYMHSEENDAVDRAFTQSKFDAKEWQPSDKTPAEMFCEALDIAKREHPDALILTGDTVDFVSPGNIAYLRERFFGISTKVLYVYGNHEGCHDLKGGKPRDAYSLYEEMTGLSPDFWVADYGEFLVIGMDDSDHAVTTEQLVKLREQCRRNRPILLAMHIPVVTESLVSGIRQVWGEGCETHFCIGTASGDDSPETKELFHMLTREETPIIGILAGHVHFSDTSMLPGGCIQYTAAPTFDGYIRMLDIVPEPT